MNKIKTITENITSGKLLECEKYIDEMLKQKCLDALSEKKLSMLEAKNPVARRLYKKLRRRTRKFGNNSDAILIAGRKMFTAMHPVAAITAESAIDEDKNPTRIKNKQAEKMLSKGGFLKIRSGKHQSIWRHATDKTKEDFSLPHHSDELSPGLTRRIYALVSEDIILDIINND